MTGRARRQQRKRMRKAMAWARFVVELDRVAARIREFNWYGVKLGVAQVATLPKTIVRVERVT